MQSPNPTHDPYDMTVLSTLEQDGFRKLFSPEQAARATEIIQRRLNKIKAKHAAEIVAAIAKNTEKQ